MKAYFFKLIPPRPTFMQDMSEEERRLMGAHAAYWRELMARGQAAAFGPVADPRGAFGVAILQLADDADDVGARAFGAGDPVIQAGAGFTFEVHPMPSVVLRS